jgi:glucuronate isomerase
MLYPECLFYPDPAVRRAARELYQGVVALPLVCPHGHVDPRLFSDPNATFGSPADLLIIPDHYVTRMLCLQGISLESLGVPRVDGGAVESDHRKIWRTFCENFHLFRGTPSGIWLAHELSEVFGIDEKPSAANADRLYDLIAPCPVPRAPCRNRDYHAGTGTTTQEPVLPRENHESSPFHLVFVPCPVREPGLPRWNRGEGARGLPANKDGVHTEASDFWRL